MWGGGADKKLTCQLLFCLLNNFFFIILSYFFIVMSVSWFCTQLSCAAVLILFFLRLSNTLNRICICMWCSYQIESHVQTEFWWLIWVVPKFTFKIFCFSPLVTENLGEKFTMYLPNPSTMAGYDTRSVFKWSTASLKLTFSSPGLVVLPRLEKISLPYYLPIAGERKKWIHAFFKGISAKQTTSP